MISILFKTLLIILVVVAFVTAAFNSNIRKKAFGHMNKYRWQILVVVTVLLAIYVYATLGT